MITVTINDTERTSSVDLGSFRKTDILNSQVDTLSFVVLKYGAKTYKPVVGDEVIVEQDETRIFGGVIVRIAESVRGGSVVVYDVEAVDYGHYLARRLVVENYEETTANAIIADIMDTYAPDFTYTGVDADVPIASISFNRVPVNEALQKLADATGFSWYVDEFQDLHFFAKNTEPAPFDLTDTSDNYVIDSLEITNDITQLRNRVFVQGGDAIGEARTEVFDGNGVRKQFALSNKFSELPTVEVDSVAKTVGVEFLQDEADYDCMWDFNQKYIRFKDSTIPPATAPNNVTVTGTPIYSVIVQVQHPPSIAENGVWEFVRRDKQIKTRAEAVAFGTAELEAYKNVVNEGAFVTYTTGLRSGQIINITSTVRGVNEDFLIQRVTMKMQGVESPVYEVRLATLKTVGIIDFLIGLLRSGSRQVEDADDSVLEKIESPVETVEVTDVVSTSVVHNTQSETVEVGEVFTNQGPDYAVQFVLGPQVPDGVKRVFILDGSPLS